jgi:hypothetical protein
MIEIDPRRVEAALHALAAGTEGVEGAKERLHLVALPAEIVLSVAER